MFKTALKFILFDKPKSLGALAGMVISIFLVGQQVGIFIFLTNAMKSLVANNSGYIWVVDSKTENANQLANLDVRVGRELASIPGVEKVYPVVVAPGAAKFANGKTAALLIVGAQAPEFVGGPWGEIPINPARMLPEGAVVTEYFEKKSLGDLEVGDYFEINGNKVYNAAVTRGARGFGGGAYTFTTIERARALAKVPTDKASIFLVKWQTDVPKQAVIERINNTLSNVRAWDPEAFARSTVTSVLGSSGIAFSVGTLIVFAVITGFVIIGLTLYSAAIDRIKDYGTLKAIGATRGYITRLVLKQALLISLVGYIIGFFLIEGFRKGIANAGTAFSFPLAVHVGIFLLTLGIALGGCLFAIRRLNSVEPAAVFR